MIRAALIWALITAGFCAAVIVLAGRLMAQTPEPVPQGFWAEFWPAAKAAGFFGTALMALMWWRAERRAEIERAERISIQTAKDAQTEKTINTMNSVAVTLEATRQIVEKIVTGFDAMKDMIRDLRQVQRNQP